MLPCSSPEPGLEHHLKRKAPPQTTGRPLSIKLRSATRVPSSSRLSRLRRSTEKRRTTSQRSSFEPLPAVSLSLSLSLQNSRLNSTHCVVQPFFRELHGTRVAVSPRSGGSFASLDDAPVPVQGRNIENIDSEPFPILIWPKLPPILADMAPKLIEPNPKLVESRPISVDTPDFGRPPAAFRTKSAPNWSS